MDKVDLNFVLATNEKIVLPDIQIVVSANQDVIQARLNERERLTRFEKGKRTSEELYFLKEGTEILRNLGVDILQIENSGTLSNNVDAILSYVQKAVM